MSQMEPKPQSAQELYQKRRQHIEAIAAQERNDIVAEACRAILDVVAEDDDGNE